MTLTRDPSDLSLVETIEHSFAEGENRDIYLPVREAEFPGAISALEGKDVVLAGLFCAEDFEGHRGFTLFYAFEKKGRSNTVTLTRHLQTTECTSIAGAFPSACWYEREVRDGFGVEFTDAYDKRRLFLHETYPDDFHPLKKAFKNGPFDSIKDVSPQREYRFKEFEGEGVYQIPVGPVHAGIIEPGHFRFSVIGETILNLEVRMFYKHRGIEKLAEGKTPEQCVAIAESISGDETAANATAFSMAVERLSPGAVPARAWHLRTVLLEMERVYSHLGDMAGMIIDVAYPAGASHFFILREELFRQNAELSGSRFLKGIICPGGLRHDIPADKLQALSAYLQGFLPRFDRAVHLVLSVSSVIDRLETTGVIRKDLINALNITGPAARASGVSIDTRIDHPYGLYGLLKPRITTAEDGDVLSRFNVKAAEIRESAAIILRLISEASSGPVFASPETRDGHALSLIESARGQSLHWVRVKNGVIDRYKVRTASFCNWQAIEHAVIGNIVPDFPLINKSLNLSYAGTDL